MFLNFLFDFHFGCEYNGGNEFYHIKERIMSKKIQKISGTREWAEGTANCVTGCSHNCRYCYARYDACDKFKRVKHEDWEKKKVNEYDVKKARKRFNGPVMFPTTHDICPDVLEPCMEVISNVLSVGNDILIVSKPHLECIKAICEKFVDYKDKILFRFTIGAFNDEILSYWEPGAPSFDERLSCLKLAFESGYKTSVSCEPMLDGPNVVKLFRILEPYVNDSIWIGKMNQISNRVVIEKDTDLKAIKKIESGQTDKCIKGIYVALKNEKKVKWKESFKTVLGLELAKESGLDI